MGSSLFQLIQDSDKIILFGLKITDPILKIDGFKWFQFLSPNLWL